MSMLIFSTIFSFCLINISLQLLMVIKTSKLNCTWQLLWYTRGIDLPTLMFHHPLEVSCSPWGVRIGPEIGPVGFRSVTNWQPSGRSAGSLVWTLLVCFALSSLLISPRVAWVGWFFVALLLGIRGSGFLLDAVSSRAIIKESVGISGNQWDSPKSSRPDQQSSKSTRRVSPPGAPGFRLCAEAKHTKELAKSAPGRSSAPEGAEKDGKSPAIFDDRLGDLDGAFFRQKSIAKLAKRVSSWERTWIIEKY